MGIVTITLKQIHLNLENETRQKKGLSLIKDVDEFRALNDTDFFWNQADGIFSIPQSRLDDENKIIPTGAVIATKVFVNKETQEIRQFVSKYTDEPLTEILP